MSSVYQAMSRRDWTLCAVILHTPTIKLGLSILIFGGREGAREGGEREREGAGGRVEQSERGREEENGLWRYRNVCKSQTLSGSRH